MFLGCRVFSGKIFPGRFNFSCGNVYLVCSGVSGMRVRILVQDYGYKSLRVAVMICTPHTQIYSFRPAELMTYSLPLIVELHGGVVALCRFES